MLPQFFQQDWAEIDVAVFAALAFLYVDYHPGRIDVGDLQGGDFSPAHPGGVQRHQDGAVERGGRSVDQRRDLFGTPDDGQMHAFLRVGQFVAAPSLIQHREKEET